MTNSYKQERQEKKAADLMARCHNLLNQGKRVEAVKEYRSATCASLPEARRALGI